GGIVRAGRVPPTRVDGVQRDRGGAAVERANGAVVASHVQRGGKRVIRLGVEDRVPTNGQAILARQVDHADVVGPRRSHNEIVNHAVHVARSADSSGQGRTGGIQQRYIEGAVPT